MARRDRSTASDKKIQTAHIDKVVNFAVSPRDESQQQFDMSIWTGCIYKIRVKIAQLPLAFPPRQSSSSFWTIDALVLYLPSLYHRHPQHHYQGFHCPTATHVGCAPLGHYVTGFGSNEGSLSNKEIGFLRYIFKYHFSKEGKRFNSKLLMQEKYYINKLAITLKENIY